MESILFIRNKEQREKRRERKGSNVPESCLEPSPGIVTGQDASPEHKSQHTNNKKKQYRLFLLNPVVSLEIMRKEFDLEGELRALQQSSSTAVEIYRSNLLPQTQDLRFMILLWQSKELTR
ncbi:hypothetical protein J6590_080503 [Homalodisca vitripennis]|nr:hypothetical protein J6590_080503 [Homalodisca vitripennis]